MALNFNAFVKDGAFQTGKHEFVRLYSAHHVAATGVKLTRAELVSEGLLPSATLSSSNSIEINGTTYTADATYDDAYYAQSNLEAFYNKFAEKIHPAYVRVSDAVATASTPTADTASDLVTSETFGSQLTEGNGPVWVMDFVFEQKGVFNNVSGTSTFVKGEPSIGAAADNYGSSVAEVAEFLNGLSLVSTSVDDANAEDILGGATTPGSAIAVRTSADGSSAAEQSVLIEVNVSPNLQS